MKTSEKILTFAAIFISCLALIVSIVQTNILQKQSYAAVWPRLSIGTGQGLDYFKQTLSNDGVGPAIVSSVNYTFEDTSFVYINKLIHYFGRLEAKEKGSPVRLDFEYSNVIPGQVIPLSQKLNVFNAGDSTSVYLAKKYLSKATLEIKYCSIYDDCWMMKGDDVFKLY